MEKDNEATEVEKEQFMDDDEQVKDKIEIDVRDINSDSDSESDEDYTCVKVSEKHVKYNTMEWLRHDLCDRWMFYRYTYDDRRDEVIYNSRAKDDYYFILGAFYGELYRYTGERDTIYELFESDSTIYENELYKFLSSRDHTEYRYPGSKYKITKDNYTGRIVISNVARAEAKYSDKPLYSANHYASNEHSTVEDDYYYILRVIYSDKWMAKLYDDPLYDTFAYRGNGYNVRNPLMEFLNSSEIVFQLWGSKIRIERYADHTIVITEVEKKTYPKLQHVRSGHHEM